MKNLNEQIKEQVREQIWCRAWNQIWDRDSKTPEWFGWYKMRQQISGPIWELTWDPIGNQIVTQIQNQTK